MTIRIRFKKIIRSIQFYSAQNNYSGKSYLLRNSNDSYHWKKDSSTSYQLFAKTFSLCFLFVANKEKHYFFLIFLQMLGLYPLLSAFPCSLDQRNLFCSLLINCFILTFLNDFSSCGVHKRHLKTLWWTACSYWKPEKKERSLKQLCSNSSLQTYC